MLESQSKMNLLNLIRKLPEEEIPVVTKFVQFVLHNIDNENDKNEEFFKALNTLPEDNESWTDDDEKDLIETDQEIGRGEVISWNEYKSVRGMK